MIGKSILGEYIPKKGGSMYTFKVSGMTCPSCASSIKAVLKRKDPEIEVSVDIQHQIVKVKSSLNREALADMINDIGYPVEKSENAS